MQQSSKHVARLAKQLLHGLLAGDCVPAPLKTLTPNDAFLLEAAALVHHVGMFISHSECHGHAYYIIKNDSHLLGFTPLELEIVALMCKFHRKDYPDAARHPEVAALPLAEQEKLCTRPRRLRFFFFAFSCVFFFIFSTALSLDEQEKLCTLRRRLS